MVTSEFLTPTAIIPSSADSSIPNTSHFQTTNSDVVGMQSLFQKSTQGDVFCSVDSFLENATAEVAAGTIRIEAEDLSLDGYNVETFKSSKQVSGDSLISLKETPQKQGGATGLFQGPDGVYDVVVGYYDETDGVARASVTIADETDAFKLDQSLDSKWVNPRNAVERLTHESVSLTAGDRIKIKATARGGEFARFDYIDFKPVEGPSDPVIPDTPTSTTPADSTLAPLNTSDITLPKGINDYAFVSNYEQVAYVSKDTASMIYFNLGRENDPDFGKKYSDTDPNKPDVPSLPELQLYLPEGIEIQSAIRKVSIENSDSVETINGKQFTNVWTIKPKDNGASNFTLTWKADGSQNWQEGQKLTGYFRGDRGEGEIQEPQALDIEVVDVRETEAFEEIPVWLSLPSDLTAGWEETDDFSHIGINQMDLWSYAWDGGTDKEDDDNDPDTIANQNGDIRTLINSKNKLTNSDILPVPWLRDIWWELAAKEAENRAKDPDGKDHEKPGSTEGNPKFSLNLTYDGDYFKEWINQGKDLIDRGMYLHSFDPEMYRDAENIDYSEQTLDAFNADYYGPSWEEQDYIDPRVSDSPEIEKAWKRFKADRYTEFFRKYRTDMEAHMDSIGIDRSETPFEMKALTTYHRFWRGFHGYEDYTDSPVYSKTLEDPKMLAEVFDYISPMEYPDIYANGNDYDMKSVRKDTTSMDKLVKGSSLDTEVTPIFSAGYAFQKNFEADTSAEMLKSNILEAIVAGAHGFGIWGETKIDAKDMKVIAQSVGMLQPYEDILLTGNPTGGVNVEGKVAFAHRLAGKNGSLVLVSDYSTETKQPIVNMDFNNSDDVVIDLDNPGVELSTTSNADGTTTFNTELSDSGSRVKMFYVGARR